MCPPPDKKQWLTFVKVSILSIHYHGGTTQTLCIFDGANSHTIGKEEKRWRGEGVLDCVSLLDRI